MLRKSTSLLAVGLVCLAAAAQGTLSLARYVFKENFDKVDRIEQTKLTPINKGGTSLVPTPGGGKRLALNNDAGFRIPTGNRNRVCLSFAFDYGTGSGTFKLGDDRDPLHGFSKILNIGPDRRLVLSNGKTKFILAKSTTYKISVTWRWLDPKTYVVERVQIANGSTVKSFLVGRPQVGKKGAPLSFRHCGTGRVYVDDIQVIGK